MSSLFIAEYSGLAATDLVDSIPVVAEVSHLADQVVTFTATPGVSAAFQGGTTLGVGTRSHVNGAPQTPATKWVLITADVSCSIVFGPLATVTGAPAAVTNQLLPANLPRLCRVPENQGWAISVIANS